jgi:uncharacterized membrane protein
LINFIPLATTLVSGAFTVLLWIQYARRQRLHQLVWTVAMALFTLGAGLEFAMNPGVLGPSEFLVRLYYLTIGPQVSLLGTGVLLLMSPKWGRRTLWVVVALSVVSFVWGSLIPIDISAAEKSFQLSVVFGINAATHSFPSSIRLLTAALDIYGAAALIGGSLLSFALDRHRTYSLLIVAGGLSNAVGGTLLGIFGNPDVFLEFELLGAIALFAGFLMSYRFKGTAPASSMSADIHSRAPARVPASRRYALAAIFGAVIFTSKVFAPTPMKDSFIVIQALLLGLGALILTPLGGTLVATIGGLLTASFNPQLAVFTILFAFIYGLLIDGSIWAMKARANENEIHAHRFALAVTVSTAIIGFVAYGTTIALGLLPRNPSAEVFILVGGIVSGLIGGYLDVIIWRRAAKYFFA